ncbi:MAG: hypothetical protein QXY45_04570 [Candidatus Aenigmatarchaeota archaeon]
MSVFKMSNIPEKLEIIYRIDGEEMGNCRFFAKQSRHDEEEIEIEVLHEEDLEKGVKFLFSNDALDVIKYLKEKGKEKIQRRILCFINRKLGTFEIYRGKDHVTAKIKESIERLLNVELEHLNLKPDSLMRIANTSEEIKQAIFKYIHGMWYQILRGNKLENNQKYLEYLSTKPESLRVISVIPKINWSNGSKYTVTFNGETGVIKMWDGFYNIRPRQEVRQLVGLMVNFD